MDTALPSVLAFDVFGTVVDWHGSIVREVSEHYPTVDANALALAWRAGYQPAMERVRKGQRGWVRLDPASRSFDQGVGGLQTAGSFSKLNLEFQRAQFFSNPSSVHVNIQAQLASKNLASAEKMSLGGPTGVRAYPVGEGIGDGGLLVNLEYRYQLPAPLALAGQPVSLAAFYDYGTVKFNQDAMTLVGPNRVALGAVGVGALAGRVNNFLITTYLAWPTTAIGPSTGDPDRSPRAWVSAQKWF